MIALQPPRRWVDDDGFVLLRSSAVVLANLNANITTSSALNQTVFDRRVYRLAFGVISVPSRRASNGRSGWQPTVGAYQAARRAVR